MSPGDEPRRRAARPHRHPGDRSRRRAGTATPPTLDLDPARAGRQRSAALHLLARQMARPRRRTAALIVEPEEPTHEPAREAQARALRLESPKRARSPGWPAPGGRDLFAREDCEDQVGAGPLILDGLRRRPRYFDGRFLTGADLTRDQDYVRQRQADMARAGGTGVVSRPPGAQPRSVRGPDASDQPRASALTPSGDLVMVTTRRDVPLLDLPLTRASSTRRWACARSRACRSAAAPASSSSRCARWSSPPTRSPPIRARSPGERRSRTATSSRRPRSP